MSLVNEIKKSMRERPEDWVAQECKLVDTKTGLMLWTANGWLALNIYRPSYSNAPFAGRIPFFERLSLWREISKLGARQLVAANRKIESGAK